MGITAPKFKIQWKYRTNNGLKAERYGPYMLQAEIVRSSSDRQDRTQKDAIQLGVVSIECISDVAHRHSFWVITEAALESLQLDEVTRDRISSELSSVVPLPSEGEIINYKRALDALSRALRKS